jgi:hypothetical protein
MKQVNAPKRQIRRLEEDENTPTRLMFFDLSDYKNQLKDIQ